MYQFEDCGICGAQMFVDKHCSACGAYHLHARGINLHINRHGVTMVRGFRRVVAPIGLHSFTGKIDAEKLSARLAGHIFHAE